MEPLADTPGWPWCSPSQTQCCWDIHANLSWASTNSTTRLLPYSFLRAAHSCDCLNLVWKCLSSLKFSVPSAALLLVLFADHWSQSPRLSSASTHGFHHPLLAHFLSRTCYNLYSGCSHLNPGPLGFYFSASFRLKMDFFFYPYLTL